MISFERNKQRFAFLAEPMDRLTYQEYLSVVHEYWYPPDEDRQHLEEAFDTLDPKRTAKLMIDDFTNLLKNCGGGNRTAFVTSDVCGRIFSLRW